MALIKMTPAADIEYGDMLDLEGDEYFAYDEETSGYNWTTYEYACVAGVVIHGGCTIGLEFDNGYYLEVPNHHELKRVI